MSKDKPSKPYADFPLYAHGAGQWAKKIRGKVHYFGPWKDWRASLDKYLSQRDDLQAGREPRAKTVSGATVLDLVNIFLTDKHNLRAAGELSDRSFNDYRTTSARVLASFGKGRQVSDIRPGDFSKLRASYPEEWSLTTILNEINRTRVIFNYAGPNALGLVDEPVSFGPMFKRPSAKARRIERGKKPKKLYEPETVRAMLERAEPTLRAMILLGINAGLGNRDCAELRARNVLTAGEPLSAGWLVYPRPKTGVDRRARLWPETISAIALVVAGRDLEPDDLVFITKYGRPFYREGIKTGSCAIATNTRKLLDRLKLYRPGLSFYALRHTFQTIGEKSGDLVAVSSIMGHIDNSMAGNYREMIDDDRLESVSRAVHQWLFDN